MLWPLVKKELFDALRNRWLILYAVIYAVLGLSLSYFSSLGLGYLGFRAFGRVSAALINMTLYLVPLMAMSLAGLSIIGERERGTLEIILSQPLSKAEVLLSKYIGITVSVALATALGYGAAAWYLWAILSSGDLIIYLQIMATCILLAATLTGLGLLISTLSRSRFEALGIILMTWLSLLVIYDLILMGAAIGAQLKWEQIFTLLAINPVESARLLMVYALDPSLLVLGPTSAYIAKNIGETLPTLLTSSLIAWTAATLAATLTLFKRQDM